LRTSLEISNADPALWFEFGEVAMSLGRVPLALYAFQSACKLSPEALYLYSYAKVLAMTHDYINSLVICNYLLDTFAYSQAEELKSFIHAQSSGQPSTLDLKLPITKSEVSKEVIPVKKIWNLYSLCVAVRQVASNKDGILYKYEKSEPGAVKRKKADKYLPPECKFWVILEKYKKKILENTQSACFGFVPEKVHKNSMSSSKVTAKFEPEIAGFIANEVNYRKISEDILNFLCKNNPRPSTLLSAEVSTEVLKLYTLTKDSLELEDEYLTLLEIANSEAPELINELRIKLTSTYKLNDQLNFRCYAALASAYFQTRDLYEKNQESLVQLLYNSYMYAQKALELIGDSSFYLWWSDSFINKKELQGLIDEVLVDLECVELEKAIKGGIRLAQSSLSLLDRITRIMVCCYRRDDPQFYWKKMKMILKNLGKFQFNPEQNHLFAVCLSRYIAVLLYTLENGGKINNDHDIKGLLAMLTENMNYYLLSPETVSQLLVSTINLLRHCSKNLQQIPFLFKKVFKDLDPNYLPIVFKDFHKIIDKKDTKFHLTLCKEFEKSCLMFNSKSKKIIFGWLYGLSSKKCSCHARFPQSPVVLPNSSKKLFRVTQYLDFPFYLRQEISSDIQVLNFFSSLYSKEPRFFVTCQIRQSKKAEDLMIPEDFHINCCSETVRNTAIQAYKRFVVELISAAQAANLKDIKESAKYLRTAVDVLSLGLSLDPAECELWALLGSCYMWRWILLFYDLLTTVEQPADQSDQVVLSFKAFEKACLTDNQQLMAFVVEQKAYLSFLYSEFDKTKEIPCFDDQHPLESPRLIVLRLLLLDKIKKKQKNEMNFKVNSSVKHPIFLKLNYLQTLQESELNQLIDAKDDKDVKDALSRYYEGKILGNWLEILENNFLTLNMPCPDLKIHRPTELWKIRRKVGEKCLKVCEKLADEVKIKGILSKFSSICAKSKKNREALRVITTGIRTLAVSLGNFELAKEEIEKSNILNSKEKLSLKTELGLSN
jgi:hypothetical protein